MFFLNVEIKYKHIEYSFNKYNAIIYLFGKNPPFHLLDQVYFYLQKHIIQHKIKENIKLQYTFLKKKIIIIKNEFICSYVFSIVKIV